MSGKKKNKENGDTVETSKFDVVVVRMAVCVILVFCTLHQN